MLLARACRNAAKFKQRYVQVRSATCFGELLRFSMSWNPTFWPMNRALIDPASISRDLSHCHAAGIQAV
jgi:hypothetical protein